MAVLSSDLIRQGASGASTGYTIDQSIRFNQGDNAYMHRTPSGAGNRRTWTWSGWLKHSQESTNGYHNIWTARSGSNDYFEIAKRVTAAGDNHMDIINKISNTTGLRLVTNRDFRDPAAWYHFVFVADTTNVDPSARFRFYVNGIRETSFETETLPSQNYDTYINTTNKHEIGAYNGGSGYMMDGYMADINFIDGYAYGPEYFGEFKEDTDIWIPIKYTGSYGTNGYHIDGRDSGDLGDDESGNGNDYTTVNLAANDQMIDTPTNNFCKMNSVYNDVNNISSVLYTEGDLKVDGTSTAFDITGFTFLLPKSGKWYIEYTIGGSYDGFGYVIASELSAISASNGLGQVSAAQGGGIQYRGWRNGGSYTTTFADYASSNFSSGDIHQIAIDVDNNDFYYGIANVYQAADAGKDGNPSAGSNPLVADFPFSTNDVYLLTAVTTDSDPQHWNFGQNGTFNGTKTAQGNSDANGIGNFYYAVPTGFLALCSSNLGSV